MNKLKLAAIGCGYRTQIYASLAADMPKYYELVAAADPVEYRTERIREISKNPVFRCFKDANEILAQNKLADVMIVGTQDAFHFEPCKRAMERGYNILLEKPIAQSIDEVIELESVANNLDRKVLVCHVLRYTPFYRKIKEIVNSGVLGEIISLNANEGVEPWHHSHSFVRGPYAVTEKATPMIVAKCCHDMDLLSWLLEQNCVAISSFGTLSHFNKKNAPKGSPVRCTDGCPVGTTCMYNAMEYAGKRRDVWLSAVWDNAMKATHEEIVDYLKKSQWGRCVYKCDNNTVDHQVLTLLFEKDITATFTMTAFERERHLEIFGTEGILKAGEFYRKFTGNDIIVVKHNSDAATTYKIEQTAGCDDHMGGDLGLMTELYSQMTGEGPEQMQSSISQSVQSHVMAFAAEEARLSGKVVNLSEFYSRHQKT